MDIVASRVPVEGTPLSVVNAVRTETVLGGAAPWHLPTVFGAFTLAVLFISIMFLRTHLRTMVLKARFDESSKGKQEVEKKNRRLKEEIYQRQKAEKALRQSYKELRATQAQLIQSGKLASIGEMAAGVAHELNQPLMVIRSTGQYLLRKMESTVRKPEKAVPLLERINRGTGKMKKIIDHLRTFSRQSQAEFVPLDVNRIIENCFFMMGEQLRLRRIEIIKTLKQNLPKVLGDANQLEQVLLNLIANARDVIISDGNGRPVKNASPAAEKREEHSNYPGRIEIVTRVAHKESHGSGPEKNDDENLKAVRSERFVEILVIDTGSGIPSENLGRIFDPFFTTKEVGKGTGLGLSISFGIMEMHNGEIKVAENGPGGSTFIVRLPCIQEVPQNTNNEGAPAVQERQGWNANCEMDRTNG